MTELKQALEDVLQSLGESTQFAASGSLPPVLPGLEVKGIGPIGTPVSVEDAKRLISKATQAPYGRGEETIVDTAVRRVWQLEASQFSLRNAEWQSHVAEIVEAVKREFGIHQKVTPQLYKLLVYEKGSFFAPHRDTEKTPGMFATLVICLPSRHKGGTLIVRHDGHAMAIDFGGKEAEFATQYAAFYADCQHEVKPVTSGYRICVVYSLAIARKRQPSAPQNAAAVQTAADILLRLFTDASSSLHKIAIPLQHQYTEAGLDPKQLKGADRARLDVLKRAADSLGCHCYLALLTHHQSGEVDYSTWGYELHRRRSYYWDDDDEDEDEDEDADDSDACDAEMGDVYEEEMSLDHWLDAEGQPQPFGTVHLEESEILDPQAREGWHCRQQVHEATGNEGVSMERWYHQAVVVIWPPDRHFGILAREGPESAVPVLEEMAARSRESDAVEECRDFAREIIQHWSEGYRFGNRDSSYPSRMLKVLSRIGTADLLERFLRDVLSKQFDGSEGKPLHRVLQRFGWAPFSAALRDFLAQQSADRYLVQLADIVSVCKSLCCDPPALTEERRIVCCSIAQQLAEIIQRWDAKQPRGWYQADDERAAIVEGAFRIFATVSPTDHLDWFVDHVVSEQGHYDLHASLIPGVKAIHQWIAAIPAAAPIADRLLQHCIAALRAATSQPIEPPSDWKREATLGCKCADCRVLSAFLRDPTQRVGRFPLRKERRQHLHQQIEKHRCDVTHVTERKGSPQTLVCTKTQASYERRLEQYGVDKKLLAELESLVAKRSKATAEASRRRRKG